MLMNEANKCQLPFTTLIDDQSDSLNALNFMMKMI